MLKNGIKNALKSVAEFTYKYLEKDSGNMLLITSMTGIALSCLAQTCAIMFNSKYKKSEKLFMVPQELSEGCLTILSTFVVAKPIQKFTKKLVQTGKLTNKEILGYLEENGLAKKRGELDFNIREKILGIISEIEKSDKFIKSNSSEQSALISKHQDMVRNYDAFLDSSSAIATTGAAMITTALVTPTLRNLVASNYHRKKLQTMNNTVTPYSYSKTQDMKI